MSHAYSMHAHARARFAAARPDGPGEVHGLHTPDRGLVLGVHLVVNAAGGLDFDVERDDFPFEHGVREGIEGCFGGGHA